MHHTLGFGNRARDNQRSKVYNAERILEHFDGDLRSLECCQLVLSKIQQSRWYHSEYPWAYRFTEVADGRGSRCARAVGVREIHLPRWSRQVWVILHELAHVITHHVDHTKDDYYRCAPHGPEFCKVYLQLVKRWMGKEAWAALRKEFKSRRVKYAVNYTEPT